MFRSRLVLITIVIGCSLSGMVYAQSENQINNEKARDLLNKMRTSRNKMKNLQFDVNNVIWGKTMPTLSGMSTNMRECTLYDTFKIVMD